MRVRWCCAEFKEKAGAGKVTLIGIRKEESARRAKRNEVEINNHKFSGTLEDLDAYREARNNPKEKRGRKSRKEKYSIVTASGEHTVGCIRGEESLIISPIIHWTEEDVWEFLNDVMQVPHCSLYDEGWKRIGCIGCPMSSHKQKKIENERYPHVKRNWLRAIKLIRRGGIRERICVVEHQTGLDASRKRQRIAQDEGGWICHPDTWHWVRKSSMGGQNWQPPRMEDGEPRTGESGRVFRVLIF